MRIDFHTHAFPDAIAAKAIEKLAFSAGGLPHYTNGSYAELDNACRQAGIDVHVVLSIAVKPHQMQTVNNAAWQMESPSLVPFGSVHPYAPDCLEEARRLKDMGFKGVKLHPEYQGFEVDDPAIFPLYQLLGQLNLITVFHAGDDLGFATPPKCTPEKLKKALPFFEGGVVVAAHMGGMNRWLDVLKYLVGEQNLYVDTAYSHTHIPPAAALEIIRSHGPDKVLFGSDCPWGNIAQEIAFIQRLGLSPQEEEMILGGNAQRLLNL
ncbi:MAG: amidohydrolase family protein [Clostridia bacterium]|nr:amidohydrolase family protein [Clostridia bacterium]